MYLVLPLYYADWQDAIIFTELSDAEEYIKKHSNKKLRIENFIFVNGHYVYENKHDEKKSENISK